MPISFHPIVEPVSVLKETVDRRGLSFCEIAHVNTIGRPAWHALMLVAARQFCGTGTRHCRMKALPRGTAPILANCPKRERPWPHGVGFVVRTCRKPWAPTAYAYGVCHEIPRHLCRAWSGACCRGTRGARANGDHTTATGHGSSRDRRIATDGNRADYRDGPHDTARAGANGAPSNRDDAHHHAPGRACADDGRSHRAGYAATAL